MQQSAAPERILRVLSYPTNRSFPLLSIVTKQLETAFGLTGRIVYDSSVYHETTNKTTTVYFTVLSDSTTGKSGQEGANVILTYVGKTKINSLGTFPLVVVQAIEPNNAMTSSDVIVIAGAGYTPIDPNPTTPGMGAGGVIAILFVIGVLIGGAFVVYKRRYSSGTTGGAAKPPTLPPKSPGRV